ncbi:MAG: hypothetical protein KGL39_33140 [Patescibacteria group bacterium]|nr:hypothetical protein [Patescibacteria group bacterium]
MPRKKTDAETADLEQTPPEETAGSTGDTPEEEPDLEQAPPEETAAAEAPPVPAAPDPPILQRHQHAVPEHQQLKPHECPTCRTAMSVYGNFAQCGGCGLKKRVA